MKENYWKANNHNDLLNLWVGEHYGESPDLSIDLIRQSKTHEANNVVEMLSLNKDNIAIDLGSGGGFIANKVAPLVKKLYCLDISEDFLNYCRQETQQHSNIDYVLMKYADFGIAADLQVDAIYAMAIFVHFNLYDIFHYLSSCYKCLKPGGKLLFDFYNVEQLNIHDNTFCKHALKYLTNPSDLANYVYYNHPLTVYQLYSQIGFKLISDRKENNHNFLVLEKQ